MTALRCRAGDLAMIVRSLVGNESRLVRVLELTPVDLYDCGPEWHVEAMQTMRSRDVLTGAIEVLHPGEYAFMPDAFLRPLRDGDGVDEMLRVAGLPREHAGA